MWAAFVYFGIVGHTYFVEGNTYEDSEVRLKKAYGLVPPATSSDGQVFCETSLNAMFRLFNIDESDIDREFVDKMYRVKRMREIVKQDGEFCKFCGNFFGMAVPNQADGTLVCWSCRASNKWRL